MALTRFGVHAYDFGPEDVGACIEALKVLLLTNGGPVTLTVGEQELALTEKLTETLGELLAVVAAKQNVSVFIVDKGRRVNAIEAATMVGMDWRDIRLTDFPNSSPKLVKIEDVMEFATKRGVTVPAAELRP